MSAPAGGRAPLARQRLTGGDFTRIYAEGRRAHGELFAVVVRENALGRTRMGLSVSKRQAREAVDRNRVRRILREAFRLERGALPVGIDIVLVATRPAPPAPALAAVRAELVALVARALKKPPRVGRAAPAEER